MRGFDSMSLRGLIQVVSYSVNRKSVTARFGFLTTHLITSLLNKPEIVILENALAQSQKKEQTKKEIRN